MLDRGSSGVATSIIHFFAAISATVVANAGPLPDLRRVSLEVLKAPRYAASVFGLIGE